MSVSEVSAHLIRRSVDIDPTEVGALYNIRLAQDAAHRGLMTCEHGSDAAAEWLVLINHLDELGRIARAAADSRFDPSGL